MFFFVHACWVAAAGHNENERKEKKTIQPPQQYLVSCVLSRLYIFLFPKNSPDYKEHV